MDVPLTISIGAFIGLSSGMFGIGGALLATPLLRIVLGLTEIHAVATPLPAAIPAALSGTFVYVRKRLVRFDVAWRVLLIAVPFSQVGVLVTELTAGIVLMVLTGIVLGYSAWLFIERGFKRSDAAAQHDETVNDVVRQPRTYDTAMTYLSGAAAGFVSGFLAIGGGIILVPAFLKLLKMPTKEAVATSLFCVAGLAVPGTIGHTIADNIRWDVAVLLAIGVIPFGYLGARIASGMQTKTLERAYGFVMLAFAVFFVAHQLATYRN
jgi:uncharacterized membrane protein YfcA